jgi:hypothetical protein
MNGTFFHKPRLMSGRRLFTMSIAAASFCQRAWIGPERNKTLRRFYAFFTLCHCGAVCWVATMGNLCGLLLCSGIIVHLQTFLTISWAPCLPFESAFFVTWNQSYDRYIFRNSAAVVRCRYLHKLECLAKELSYLLVDTHWFTNVPVLQTVNVMYCNVL